jgi:hypothetical protein
MSRKYFGRCRALGLAKMRRAFSGCFLPFDAHPGIAKLIDHDLPADCWNFTMSSPIDTVCVPNLDGLGSRRDRFFAAGMFSELAFSSSRLPRISRIRIRDT